MDIAKDVYLTLTGELIEEFRLPWVEDAFAEGGNCVRNYAAMLDAYQRLRGRLGSVDGDRDVEIIIHSLLENQEELCLKMFQYGMLWHQQICR